jgi:transcriptional regulator with XRE-family HTH domain
MLSATLEDGLNRYAIGPKVRALRLGKGLGLVQLGEHTGLSPAMLSKIERGQLFPTLPTLLRIALVFGVGLEHFFVDVQPGPVAEVTRKGERLRLPDRPGAEPPAYYFESLDFPVTERKMEGYLAEFPPGAKPSDAHSHAGVELIYVITGELIVTIEDSDIALSAGDSMYFDSTASHSYRRQGRSTCSAIVVVSPA